MGDGEEQRDLQPPGVQHGHLAQHLTVSIAFAPAEQMGPVPLKPKGQDNAGRHPRGGNWRGGRHRTNGIYAAGGFEIRTCASRSKIPAIPVGHFAARCFSCECLLCDSGVLCVHVCAGVSTLV